ncbi:hypothetical protein F383_30068 [Gossypium arboreum]|uniref:Uncharacterized protein n=1 Tax=Gossypium arboreum TaxID=29729 RepID=A0A0B0MQX1_GOSAR|nr:hypothetical protein F383_30068 [Gossypium arboreum]
MYLSRIKIHIVIYLIEMPVDSFEIIRIQGSQTWSYM